MQWREVLAQRKEKGCRKWVFAIFQSVRRAPGKSREGREKALLNSSYQIPSDLLKHPSLSEGRAWGVRSVFVGIVGCGVIGRP